MEELTVEGRAWAEANASDSINARVALQGYSSNWPEGHVETAIKLANDRGRETKAELPFAVLVDVETDWPEVVFVGDWQAAHDVEAALPADVRSTVTGLVEPEEAIREARGEPAEL